MAQKKPFTTFRTFKPEINAMYIDMNGFTDGFGFTKWRFMLIIPPSPSALPLEESPKDDDRRDAVWLSVSWKLAVSKALSLSPSEVTVA